MTIHIPMEVITVGAVLLCLGLLVVSLALAIYANVRARAIEPTIIVLCQIVRVLAQDVGRADLYPHLEKLVEMMELLSRNPWKEAEKTK